MAQERFPATYILPQAMIDRVKELSDKTMAPASRHVEKALADYLPKAEAAAGIKPTTSTARG